ncbi:MAG: adenylate/guanylate cyclase domain-containing protein [Desulfobacteraceae bacterium]|jgi:predicted ATPase/class 3 adenylate cyclase
MKCPKCQHENPDDAKFCNECATKLELVCPECGKVNPPGSKFCNECAHGLSTPSAEPTPKDLSLDDKLDKIQRYLPKGLTEKILSQRDRIEGERKQVTVMFCDMEGFTQLSERLGPEEVYSIMDEVYEILIHKVHDYEGTVNEMTGDGIMALFGAPIALEDAPQRAIRSAMAIHREMTIFSDKIRQEKQGIPPLKMRIGVHTGPVVVGTLGNDLRVEFKAVGDTVNLASRVESLAVPGATYVTEETFRLAEGLFRFEALGQKEVKGKAEPVDVYHVIAPSTRRTRFDVSAERGLTPFVGRERELELVLDGFQRAKTGRGQAFSIMAEAGVGKSRLLYEFRKAVTHEDVTFLEGRCLSYSRGVAYHPIIDILKANFDIREGDGDSQITEKVKRGLKILVADEASTLPYLLELLSVKESGIDEIPLSPEAKKNRIMEAIKRITLKGSEIRPLILAYEDLHWMDKSSEDVLKYLLEGIAGSRVLLIFTYRPEFVHTWGGKSYHSQVNLNRLSNRESLAVVYYLLGTEEIDRDLEELILEKTEGVPFFIEDFIKSLQDLKIIKRTDNKYYLAKDIKDLVIPSAIQDMIMARVDSLPEGAKGVLQTGSVAGRELSYDLIEMVMGLSETELLSHLSALKDSELLYERGIYPQTTYIFKHSLIQDATYQSLLKSTRQKYHQKIAQVMEQYFPDTIETQPELLAHHYTEAGLNEQAVGYWHQAGQRATQRSANVEAINHLTKGIEVLMTLPDTLERASQELDMQTTLGPVLMAVKGQSSPDTERAYARARELCQQVGETPQLFPVLHGLWRFYMVRAQLQTTRELAEQLFTLAQRAQDPGLLLEAHRIMGLTMYWLGEMAPARAHLEQGIALYDPQQHRSHAFMYGQDPGVACRCLAAWPIWVLGYPDQALQSIHEALTLAQDVNHPFSLVYAQMLSATVHQFRREAQAVQERAEEMIGLSTEQGFAFWLAYGTMLGGWALTAQGKGADGVAQIHQALAAYRATGSEVDRPYFLALLAEAYGVVGQPEEGLTVLAEALAIVENTGERSWETELHRCKGALLLIQQGQNVGEAEECFRKAIDTARRQQAKSLELRAAMSLSRLWQQQGKQEEAHQLLEEIYNWFTEGFDTADLKEAKVLLEELA